MQALRSIAGMKSLARIVVSFCMTAVLFLVGESLRHPHPCADCFQAHGFPFTYIHDPSFTRLGDFYRGWLIADILAFALLTALIAWGWTWFVGKRRAAQTVSDQPVDSK